MPAAPASPHAVAIIGGGCASLARALARTAVRPPHGVGALNDHDWADRLRANAAAQSALGSCALNAPCLPGMPQAPVFRSRACDSVPEWHLARPGPMALPAPHPATLNMHHGILDDVRSL